MARKILFIDIDGTLLGYRADGPFIPDSAVQAIRRARKKGNQVWLCTGRTIGEVDRFVLAPGFDGIIASVGGYIRRGEQIVQNRHLPEDRLTDLMKRFQDRSLHFYLETDTFLFADSETRQWLRDMGMDGFLEKFRPLEEAEPGRTGKLTVCAPAELWAAEFGDLAEHYRLDLAGWAGKETVCAELSPKENSKGAAVRQVLEQLGIPAGDAFGFGDSMNDREMFAACGTAVAMGNAPKAVQELADYVTASLTEDGLARAMEQLGLA